MTATLGPSRTSDQFSTFDSRTLTTVGPKPAGKPSFRPDAVDLLSLYYALAFIVPGDRVIGPLGSAGRLSYVLGVVLMLMWVTTKLIHHPPRATRPPAQPQNLLFWLYGLALVMSGFVAMLRAISGPEYQLFLLNVFVFASMFGVALVARDGITSMHRLHILLRRIVIVSLFSTTLAAIEFVTNNDLSLKLNLPGLTQIPPIAQRSRFGVVRVHGTAYHAIELGVVLPMVAGLAIHCALHARSHLERRFMWGVAAASLVISTFSSSRSQFIAVGLVLLPIYLAWRAGWKLLGVAGFVAGIPVVNLIAPGLLAGVLGLFSEIGSDDSAAARTGDYPIAFNAWRRYPVFGRGLGTWGPTNLADISKPGRLLDNGWLGELITTGVFGVATLALLLFGTMAMARRIYRWGRTNEQRHMALVLFSLVLTSAVTFLLFDGFYYSQFVALMFGSIGMVGALWRLASDPNAPDDERIDPDVLRFRRTTRRSPWRASLAPDRTLGPSRWESVTSLPDSHAEFWERREAGREKWDRAMDLQAGFEARDHQP